MMLEILDHVIDDDEAHAVVNRLLDALPAGSYLAMSHFTAEVHGAAVEEAIRLWNSTGAVPVRTRSRHELTSFFNRLELLEPGWSRARGGALSAATSGSLRRFIVTVV